MFLQKKQKKSSRNKYVTVKVKGGTRNYISEKLILTQCLLFNPICNMQFNLGKTDFRVMGIKVIINKLG